jgi:hypothetical protein
VYEVKIHASVATTWEGAFWEGDGQRRRKGCEHMSIRVFGLFLDKKQIFDALSSF